MDSPLDGRSSLTACSNGKATLTTSRRSFLAGWKLCAGAALGLGLVGHSAPAQANNNGNGNGNNGNGNGNNGNGNGNNGNGNGNGNNNHSCFLAGTQIKTIKGEVCIEDLRIGDRVSTVSGEAKRIKFIGRRGVSRDPSQSWTGAGPVKISRFAIDGKAPQSDLYVSPRHAIYIDSMLIPAKYLVNGVTIVADAKPEALSLTYFHIELDTHEAILAEGLAVESFLRDNSDAFDNADEYVRLYGSPAEPLTPFVPYIPYSGRRELASHIRSALAPVYDFRKPIDRVRDRIADHADFAQAA